MAIPAWNYVAGNLSWTDPSLWTIGPGAPRDEPLKLTDRVVLMDSDTLEPIRILELPHGTAARLAAMGSCRLRVMLPTSLPQFMQRQADPWVSDLRTVEISADRFYKTRRDRARVEHVFLFVHGNVLPDLDYPYRDEWWRVLAEHVAAAVPPAPVTPRLTQEVVATTRPLPGDSEAYRQASEKITAVVRECMAGQHDRLLRAAFGIRPASPAVAVASVPPAPPPALRVLLDRQPWPHVINAVEGLHGYVDVLVHNEAGEPIFQDGTWKVERFEGEVAVIPERA